MAAEHTESRAEILDKNCDVPAYADPLFLKHGAHVLVYLVGCLWILLGLRVVSERYFSRSIEGIISKYNIPPGIAGATLMAAGTSMPELISSLVGVFLSSKIETGAGTVIGSIIFNQLMIVGLCILVSPGGRLLCNPVDMARDLAYYALSIGLFVTFFHDGQVTLGEAWGFVAAYLAYTIICGCWTSILAFVLSIFGLGDTHDVETDVETAVTPSCRREESTGPRGNELELSTIPRSTTFDDASPPVNVAPVSSTTGASLPSANVPLQASVVLEIPSSTEMGITRTPSAVSGSGRSSWDATRVFGSSGGFGGALMRVSLDMRRQGGSLDMRRPERRSLDSRRLGTARGGSLDSRRPGRRDERRLDAIEPGVDLEDSNEDLMPEPQKGSSTDQDGGEENDNHHAQELEGGQGLEEEEELSPLEEFHHAFSGGLFSKIFFCLESFWVVVVWASAGWFRTRRWHLCSFFICLGWFTIQCIYLIFWLEKAGCVIGISPGVMGVVFGAAGTSIPDCLCSVFVAQKGMGSMALTNVWGSNVFDLLFALGVPWVVAMHINGGTIKVQGSDSLCIWMGALLVFFVVVAVSCKFHFNKWHGRLFVGIYVMFIAYNFANDSLHFVSQ